MNANTIMSTNEPATLPAPPSFPKLNEHNYHTWKFDIQALLQRNATWAIVSGLRDRPDTPGDHQNVKRND